MRTKSEGGWGWGGVGGVGAQHTTSRKKTPPPRVCGARCAQGQGGDKGRVGAVTRTGTPNQITTCGWKSRHITPLSVVKLNSGWDAFFSVYTQIMPLPCFMKSYVP